MNVSYRAVMRDMQQRIVSAVQLARTTGSLRTADWLTRVLGFEPDAVAVPKDELTLITADQYLGLSKSCPEKGFDRFPSSF